MRIEEQSKYSEPSTVYSVHNFSILFYCIPVYNNLLPFSAQALPGYPVTSVMNAVMPAPLNAHQQLAMQPQLQPQQMSPYQLQPHHTITVQPSELDGLQRDFGIVTGINRVVGL